MNAVPSSLASTDGSLTKTNKSALLEYIESKCPSCRVDQIPDNSALILDGMALIHALPKPLPPTFRELAEFVLHRIVSIAKVHKCTRVDFICDRYPMVSIKGAERARRAGDGSQLRRIMSGEQKLPVQWNSFLSCGQNKEELIEFFFRAWSNAPTILGDIALYVAHGELCHRIHAASVIPVPELTCDHEEADTRIALHCCHAGSSYLNVAVKSPDTDVAIILLSLMENITPDVYFLTGMKRKSRILALQDVRETIGTKVCRALIGLHVFTGCDSTSAFHGKGKRRPLDLVIKNTEYQEAFTLLGSDFNASSALQSSLEKFVCDLYGQSTHDVNEARYHLFCLHASSDELLPPNHDALQQHTYRCNYQAAVHRRGLQQTISAPSPVGHGWRLLDGQLVVHWMTTGAAPDEVLNYVHCSCKKSRCEASRCTCRTSDLSCTELCSCSNCANQTATASEQSANADEEDNEDDDSGEE